jgi:hypothetical protein
MRAVVTVKILQMSIFDKVKSLEESSLFCIYGDMLDSAPGDFS